MILTAITLACTVIDGDTLRCGQERVRLLGIDAPELPGHCRKGRTCAPGDGEASKAALTALIGRHKVRVVPITRDRYRRTVAMVYRGRVNLSCAQMRNGQAIYVARWDNGRRIAKECDIG